MSKEVTEKIPPRISGENPEGIPKIIPKTEEIVEEVQVRFTEEIPGRILEKSQHKSLKEPWNNPLRKS